jgi:hypothetical protein
MDSFIKALPVVLKASGAPEEVAEAACIATWKHAVGEGLSCHALPVQLRDQKLVVVVEDNLWKKQLEQMHAQLLFRLNFVLGQGVVTSIEVRVDSKTLAESRGPAPAARKAATDGAIPPELISAAAGIQDSELRRAFLGAATSCIRRVETSKQEQEAGAGVIEEI